MAKVFSVTLDNASSNTKAIATLAPELSSYVGTIESLAPRLSGYVGTLFLHQRCACHIINLMVKSALDVIKHYLEDIRSAVYFLILLTSALQTLRGIVLLLMFVPESLVWIWM